MFWCLGYFLSAVLILLPKALFAEDQRAILELRINDVKKGEVVIFLRESNVLVRVKDLEVAGLTSVAGRRENIRGDEYVLLNSLAPQVTFKIDERDLALSLTVQPSLLGHNILEMLANVNLDKDLPALAAGGRVVVIGSRGRVEIDPRNAMMREVTILGMTLYNASAKELESMHSAFVAGLANGTLRPVVSVELSLAEAAKAHHLVMETSTLGKIVLLP